MGYEALIAPEMFPANLLLADDPKVKRSVNTRAFQVPNPRNQSGESSSVVKSLYVKMKGTHS